MAYIFGTPEWVAQYWKALQESADYKEVAKALEGTAALVIHPDTRAGLDEGLYFLGELKSKEARPIRVVSKEEASKSDFIFMGDYLTWKAVVIGELDPVREMMRGKLKIKGNVLKLMRVARSVRVSTVVGRLIRLAARVETLFPDELSPGDIENFRVRAKAFKSP